MSEGSVCPLRCISDSFEEDALGVLPRYRGRALFLCLTFNLEFRSLQRCPAEPCLSCLFALLPAVPVSARVSMNGRSFLLPRINSDNPFAPCVKQISQSRRTNVVFLSVCSSSLFYFYRTTTLIFSSVQTPMQYRCPARVQCLRLPMLGQVLPGQVHRCDCWYHSCLVLSPPVRSSLAPS